MYRQLPKTSGGERVMDSWSLVIALGHRHGDAMALALAHRTAVSSPPEQSPTRVHGTYGLRDLGISLGELGIQSPMQCLCLASHHRSLVASTHTAVFAMSMLQDTWRYLYHRYGGANRSGGARAGV
jgi:hypothetical protein